MPFLIDAPAVIILESPGSVQFVDRLLPFWKIFNSNFKEITAPTGPPPPDPAYE